MQLHCYRILGSLEDAEDQLQETLLAAWRWLEASRVASLRAWLYRIATNRCLMVGRRSASGSGGGCGEFQDTMRRDVVVGVEGLTVRKVIAFCSADHIGPDAGLESFLLAPRADGERAADAVDVVGEG